MTNWIDAAVFAVVASAEGKQKNANRVSSNKSFSILMKKFILDLPYARPFPSTLATAELAIVVVLPWMELSLAGGSLAMIPNASQDQG